MRYAGCSVQVFLLTPRTGTHEPNPDATCRRVPDVARRHGRVPDGAVRADRRGTDQPTRGRLAVADVPVGDEAPGQVARNGPGWMRPHHRGFRAGALAGDAHP